MSSYTDDFNRPDSTTVTGWTEAGDDWSIKSNQLAPGTVTTGTIRYDSQLASADHYAEIVVAVAGGTSMGVFARSDSALTSYYLWRNNGTVWTLFANVGGTFTQIGAYTAAAVSGDVARVECNGSTIKGYVNGVLRATATDTTITAGTYVGLRSSNSSTCRYDNFAAADLADIRVQAGTATINLSASGVSTKESTAAGTAALGLTASGAATVERVASGTGLLSLAESGTAVKETAASGTATLSLASVGMSTADRSAAGTATLTLTATGVTPADQRDITLSVTPMPSRWAVAPAPSRWTVGEA